MQNTLHEPSGSGTRVVIGVIELYCTLDKPQGSETQRLRTAHEVDVTVPRVNALNMHPVSPQVKDGFNRKYPGRQARSWRPRSNKCDVCQNAVKRLI